jgi:hypothetical protein
MIFRKNIIFATALALSASPLFAGGIAYREAAAPWSAEQAVKIVPELTPAFLKTIEKEFGGTAAAGLAEKKEKVSALVERFKSCALNAEDLKTADKHFTPDFKAEVRYFAGEGCAAFQESAQGRAAAPRSVSLEGLEELSVSGAFATSEGSAKFFDGAKNGGAAPLPVRGGLSAYQAGRAAAAASSKPLASNVPAMRTEGQAQKNPKIERPADLGKEGRVNQAAAYWTALRKKNWEASKNLSGTEKAKALMKAAAGAGFGGLLIFINLTNVEIAAARVGWDAGSGASAGTIAWDATKLVFHSAVFALALAPIPLLDVAKAALAGEGWAVALMAAIAAGPVNRYVFRIL